MDIVKENISDKWTIRIKHIKDANREFLHWHPRAELCYIIEGKCEFYVNGEKFFGEEGDVLTLKSADVHRFIPGEGGCSVYISTFDPILMYKLQSDPPTLSTFISAEDMRKCGIHKKVLSFFEEMFEENNNKNEYYETIVQTKIIELYHTLARFFENKAQGAKNDMKSFEAFQKILDFISENFANDISLSDAARVINYSPSQVSAMFPKFVDANFKKYLDTVRINKAVELLKNNDLSITDIAMSSGYNNIRTFNNVFKSITGVTPTEVKKVSKRS